MTATAIYDMTAAPSLARLLCCDNALSSPSPFTLLASTVLLPKAAKNTENTAVPTKRGMPPGVEVSGTAGGGYEPI